MSILAAAAAMTDRDRARPTDALAGRLLDHASDMLSVIDAAGVRHYVNPACQRILGYRPDELIGHNAAEIDHPEDAASILAFFAELAARPGATDRCETRVLHRDGSTRWLELSVANLLDDPAIGGFVIASRDITERKTVEAELAASQARFSKAFQASPIGIVITDVAGGRFVEVNDAYLRLFGYERDELIGRTAYELRLSPRTRAERVAFVEALRAGGAARDLEGEGWTKAGERRLLSVSAELVELDGEPCVLSLVSDVTERHAADVALRESEARFRAVVQNAMDVVQIVGPDGTFRYESPAFERVTGYRPYELGVSREALFHPDDLDQVLTQWESAGRESGPHRFVPFRILHRDGAYRWIDLTLTNLLDDPAIAGFVANWRDITQEREADRMKTEFVSLVSHELRTPLTSIKGYVELLLGDEAGPLTAEQVEFLQIVGTNAERLVSLINDLLDISRIEAGKIGLHRVTLDPLAAVQEAMVLLRPQLEAKDQRVALDVSAEPAPVWADADRLTQILTNLLSNAGKYSAAGGEIRIALEATDDAVRFVVSDAGIGLSPAEQAHLFQKFYRADNQTTRAIGGTGLGLAIVRSLVELHGGRVTVQSEPGVGSSFAFTIPLATTAAS
jgi:PAS domain S-box-containing protein